MEWFAGKAFKGVPRERFAITSKCEPCVPCLHDKCFYYGIFIGYACSNLSPLSNELGPCRWGPMMKGQQFPPLDLSAQACRAAVEESLKDLQARLRF